MRAETLLRLPILESQSFHALDADVTVVAPGASAREAGSVVRALFEAWETTLGRFRPGSELSRLNRSGGRTTPVSPLLFQVVEEAIAAARTSGGIFDPTLGVSVRRLGYDRPWGEMRLSGPSLRRPVRPGGRFRDVRLSRAQGAITLPFGVELDLGGIARGMALDAALAVLEASGFTPALIDTGSEAAATSPPPGGGFWTIRSGSSPDILVPLRRGALATSSILRRHWVRGGFGLHHIVDPRTGLPACSGVLSATVAARSAAQAEVAAKCVVVLGPEAGRNFLRSRNLSALVLTDEGEASVGPFPRSPVHPV